MAEQGTRNVLSIRGMCKSFGRNRVLDHIDLDVKEGSIMGLMGENGAGKSTMMKCLFGTYQKDEGTVFLNGKEVNFSSPKESLENGIAMVHQELNQCLERNVLDNLFLGRYPLKRTGTVDENRMKTEAAELFRKLNMTVNLTVPMKTMSVSARQMVEIAKAISYNARLIVLDEPTSSLTVKEVTKLFEMMRNLKAQGISLVYISHKMDEIFKICDRVTVLRDGKYIDFKPTAVRDFFELEKVSGEYFDGNTYRTTEFSPADTDLEYLRTFKFEDLTYRGTIEYRSSCCQPIKDVMTVAAFHTGLAGKLDELGELLRNDKVLYSHGYSATALQDMLSKKELPQFIDKKAFTAQLVRILDYANDGLKARGKNEEHFLDPLYERAQQLTNPARQMVQGLESGKPMREFIENYAAI